MYYIYYLKYVKFQTAHNIYKYFVILDYVIAIKNIIINVMKYLLQMLCSKCYENA